MEKVGRSRINRPEQVCWVVLGRRWQTGNSCNAEAKSWSWAWTFCNGQEARARTADLHLSKCITFALFVCFIGFVFSLHFFSLKKRRKFFFILTHFMNWWNIFMTYSHQLFSCLVFQPDHYAYGANELWLAIQLKIDLMASQQAKLF